MTGVPAAEPGSSRRTLDQFRPLFYPISLPSAANPPCSLISASYLHVAAAQAELSAGERPEGHRHRGVATSRPGENSLFSCGAAFVSNPASQGGPDADQANLAFTRVAVVRPRPVPTGDIASGPEPAWQTAARQSSRCGRPPNKPANRQNHASEPHGRPGPVEQFDVAGPFEFSERILPFGEDFRNIAVEARAGI